jgi:copper(I)-binding protein
MSNLSLRPMTARTPNRPSFPRRIERLGRASFLAGLLILLVGQSALAHEFKLGDLTIEHPWARATPPGAAVGGGYLVVQNDGASPDTLLSATAEICDHVEMHAMAVKNGVMTMTPLPGGVEIPAGGSVAFSPSANHLMLMQLKQPLKQGEEFHGTLTFEKAGTIEIHFAVESMGAQGPEEEDGD